MPKVWVFTKNICIQCEYTKKKLTQSGIPFKEINIEEHPIARAMLSSYGYSSVPVVLAHKADIHNISDVAPDNRWQGFKIDKIRGLDVKDYCTP